MTRQSAVMLLRRFGAPVVLVTLFLVAVGSGLAKHLSLEDLRAQGQALQTFTREQPLLSAVIYVALYVVTVSISLPGALIMSLTGGFLFGPIWGGAAAVTGATGGSTVVYLVCRTAFADFLRRKPFPLLLRIEEGFRENAFSYLLTLRLIPAFPLLLVNMASGLMAIPVRTFLLASFLGMVPSSFVYAGIGAGLGHVFARGEPVSLETLLSPRIYVPIVAMGVLAFLPPLWRLWRSGRVAPTPDLKYASIMTETASPPENPPPPAARRFPWPRGLSARLLLFTAFVVTLAGLMVLPPTLAAYEEQWLLDRVRAGELASTIAESDPELRVSDSVAGQLFDQAGAVTVAVQVDGARRLVLPPKVPMQTPYLVDLRRQNPGSWLAAPFFTLTSPPGSMVRVMAEPRFRKAEFVEVVIPDAPLKAQLVGYFWRLAGVTIFVASLAGLFVYLFLNIFLVRPMQRITLAMEQFRVDPADPAARIVVSKRRDEIGRAELELDRMQTDLLTALASKARLAALGEAVAKINHDLRNMLTSAQMASDRLAALGDPKVAQALPRLERALDRAITLASDVMAYGKSKEPAPVARSIPLRAALDNAAEDSGLTAGGVALETVIDPREQVLADPDQLHRILTNLLRNAREAIEGAPDRGGKGRVFIELHRGEGLSILRLSDDGPGVPQRAQANLFQPFVGSVRRGGTGLGLAIARELAQGHGGDLVLVETGPGGSVFDLTLSGAPEPVAEPSLPPA